MQLADELAAVFKGLARDAPLLLVDGRQHHRCSVQHRVVKARIGLGHHPKGVEILFNLFAVRVWQEGQGALLKQSQQEEGLLLAQVIQFM